jgi:ketosteroid isomerase-like protein
MQRGDTAWMDEHLADDVVWHVGGNSKWAGTYEGKAKVLEFFGRQAQATETAVEIHDILGNDDHVVVLGSAKATAQDGSSAEWKYTQIFHLRDGKTTEVWGMAENDAAVDPFLDGLPG